MKKFLLATILLFSMSSFLCAQYVNITGAKVITQNGTHQRQKVVVYIKLTSDGLKAYYNNGSDIKCKVTADWSISPLLTQGSQTISFYPTFMNGGSSNGKANGATIEFECVNHEAALKLKEKGVSGSDFYIESYIK